MLSLLPDLTPRDSHSLWYTSSRNPFASNSNGIGSSNDLRYTHGNHGAFAHHPNGTYDHHNPPPQGLHLNNPNNNNNPNNGRRGGVATQHHHHQHHHNHHLIIERSPLARLRADEVNLERRRQNVSNFGSGWLKPPGIPKTLHQLREERREAEEHQEAMRREQLAQELAEAEAAGVAAAADAEDGDDMLDDVPGGEGGQEGDGMDDVQLDGARDLDEDIPEGDADFGFGSEDEEEDEEEEDDEDEDGDEGGGEDEGDRAAREQEQLMAQRMRSTQQHGGGEAVYYGAEDEVDDEDQAHMIEEEDLLSGGRHGGQNDGTADGGDLNMGADLDDDIPEAESAGYEHTDTEEELSSEDDGTDDDRDHAEMSFVGAPRAPQAATRFRNSLARSDVTRHSIAISDLLSRDGSSVAGSSPQVPGPRHSIGSYHGRGHGRGRG